MLEEAVVLLEHFRATNGASQRRLGASVGREDSALFV